MINQKKIKTYYELIKDSKNKENELKKILNESTLTKEDKIEICNIIEINLYKDCSEFITEDNKEFLELVKTVKNILKGK